MIYNYKIHVLNRDINFDMSYKNVVQFFNPADNTKDYTGVFTNQELTFDETYNENATDVINFDANDGVNASVTLDFTGDNVTTQFLTSALTIQQALSRQYCIIDEIIYNDNGVKQSSKLYFYFIVGYSLRNENIIKYNLLLDAFTTYPLFSDIEIDKTKILRAHTDRYTYDSTLSIAKYNLTNLYLRTGEDIEKQVRNKEQKESININFDNYGTFINKLEGSGTLTDNELMEIINGLKWCYVFRHTNDDRDLVHVYYIAPKWLNKKYSIDQLRIFAGGSDDVSLSTPNVEITDFELFYANQSNDPYIYNAFVSPLSPFGTNALSYCGITYNLTDSGTNLDIIFKTTNVINGTTAPAKIAFDLNQYDTTLYPLEYTTEGAFGFTFTRGHNGVYRNLMSYFEKTSLSLFNSTITTLSNTPFDYSVIDKAEPKTKLKQAFNEYIIKSVIDNSELKIDLTQLQTSTIALKASQSFTFGSNGEILLTCGNLLNNRLELRTEAQYTPQLFGDKFLEWKATNKNYAITGLALPLANTALGMGLSGADYDFGGVIKGIAGGVTREIQYFSNLDNMKNAPDSIKLKGKNFDLDFFNNKTFFYIEHNEIKEAEKNQVNAYFYEYGYNISEINNISNFFTRSSFNYIQLEDCEKDVHALINKNVLDIIVKALNNGVRFWKKSHYKTNKFKYTTNNLETKLL